MKTPRTLRRRLSLAAESLIRGNFLFLRGTVFKIYSI